MKLPDLFNRPGLAATLGALIALMGQSAFNKVFEGVYAVVTERVQFPMTLKTVEYYRRVSDPCSPQVRNTIETLNARIAYEHEANAQRFRFLAPWGFLIDWASTDRWNAVEPIGLHCADPPAVPREFVYGEPLTLPPTPPAAEVGRRRP